MDTLGVTPELPKSHHRVALFYALRWKVEEGRGKIVFESVTFSDFAYYNSREMCNFAD